MKSARFFAVVAAVVILAGLPSHAGAANSNLVINFQGRLTDADRVPINETLPIELRVYTKDTPAEGQADGALLYAERHGSVVVDNGIYNLELGAGDLIDPPNAALSADIFKDHADLWVGIKVGDDGEMVPRIHLASSPYAFHADNAARLGGYDAGDYVRTTGSETTVDLGESGKLTFGGAGIRYNDQSGLLEGSQDGETWYPIVLAIPPSITSVTPGTVFRGATDFEITVDGSNFTSTTGVVIEVSGITVVSTTKVSDTRLTARIDVAGSTALDSYPVTVDTLGLRANLQDAITVVRNPQANQADAMASCKVIKAAGFNTDGRYWIDPDGGSTANAYQGYCDMTTDGGGWTLVMQIKSSTNNDATFWWGSNHWTSATTLDESAPTALSDIHAKYATFNSFPTTDGKLLIRDKETGNSTTLAVPNMAGTTLLNRFQSLGKTDLTVTAGKASPQELMGYVAPSGMCTSNGGTGAKWVFNFDKSSGGKYAWVRIGNDVATNDGVTNDASCWPCYDGGNMNLAQSGVGGALENSQNYQDSYGSESLNGWRSGSDCGSDNGSDRRGTGSHNGAALFVK